MPTLVRTLGLAAIAGGVLRVADSFLTQALPADVLTALYFTTDVLLLLGIAGTYLSRTLGFAGVIGVATFVVGILLVRASAFGVLGPNGYQLAAAIALSGLVILSADFLSRRTGIASAMLWLSAFGFGVTGVLGIVPALMTILAGVAFGAGFIVAGVQAVALSQADLVPAG